MKDDFDLLKESYFHELDRRAGLTSALTLPIGIATLISSGLIYVSKSVSIVDSRLELAILLMITLSSISLLSAVFCICKSYIGYSYKHIPIFAKHAYRIELRDYHSGKTDADSLANSEATDYLIDNYYSSAKKNFDNNNRKSHYIYLANRALVVALGLLLLAIIPITFSEFELSADTIIKIINGSHSK